MAELLAMPGVTERVVLASRVGLLAFHGGLEGGTETVAEAVAEVSGASLYTIVQPPDVRWHLPSHVVGAEASPGLRCFLDHIDVAVAVHGYGGLGTTNHLYLGGLNRDLAARLGGKLRAQLPDWQVVDRLEAVPVAKRGVHPDNPVNRCRGRGVQLELPAPLRGSSGRWVDPNLDCRPAPGLVRALVEFAVELGGVPSGAASGQNRGPWPA